jgi:hypothetical protein
MKQCQIFAMLSIVSLMVIAVVYLWITHISPLISPNEFHDANEEPRAANAMPLNDYPTVTGVNSSIQDIANYLHLSMPSNRSKISQSSTSSTADQFCAHLNNESQSKRAVLRDLS